MWLDILQSHPWFLGDDLYLAILSIKLLVSSFYLLWVQLGHLVVIHIETRNVIIFMTYDDEMDNILEYPPK